MDDKTATLLRQITADVRHMNHLARTRGDGDTLALAMRIEERVDELDRHQCALHALPLQNTGTATVPPPVRGPL